MGGLIFKKVAEISPIKIPVQRKQQHAKGAVVLYQKGSTGDATHLPTSHAPGAMKEHLGQTNSAPAVSTQKRSAEHVKTAASSFPELSDGSSSNPMSVTAVLIVAIAVPIGVVVLILGFAFLKQQRIERSQVYQVPI